MLDYLITNAHIADPENKAEYAGSLGIKAGRIDGIYSASSPLPRAREIIDAKGGILSPGFIDPHSHTENNIPCAEKLLLMGVTTAVSGNCGQGAADFERFRQEFAKTGYPVNQAEQAGHRTLRELAGLGDVYAAADKTRIETMKGLLGKAFAQGACGLSFGLEYTPGAPPSEVIELAGTAAELGGFISIHGRLKTLDDLDSLREALDLGLITGAPLIYSHLVYMYCGERLRKALRIIEEYREKKAPVRVDSGMYTAFASFAGAAIFGEHILGHKEFSFSRFRAATGKYAGLTLDLEKYREIRRDFPGESLIYDNGCPDDIYAAYSLPDVMVSTDCMNYPAGQGHPQGAATYPCFFRVMVRERGQLSLVDAVRRCTLLPAQAAGLANKGRLSPGTDADLVVFDLERLREHADFPGLGDPDAPPSGVTHVFVNGRLAVRDEKRVPGLMAGEYLTPLFAPHSAPLPAPRPQQFSF
jgi:N-acyl-D-amino-acid deacylase